MLNKIKENSHNTILKVENISKSFHVGGVDIPILKNISFEVGSGDFVIIFGPSGCGKSTLLHALLGLEGPSTGTITFFGTDLYGLPTEDDRSQFRKVHVGMVYQQPNWIKALTVIDNIVFPQLLLGRTRGEGLTKATDLLQAVGMMEWAHYMPSELSGGQQQRIALVRALVIDPEIIIADEPTGNLDFVSGQNLMQLLQEMNQKQNKTIIMVTHDLEYLRYAKTAISIFDGAIVDIYDEKNKDKLIKDLKSKRGYGALEVAEIT